MTVAPKLAVCGSNLCGDVPVSCALQLGERVVSASAGPGVRGDLAQLVAELCREHSVAPASLVEIRVDVGPGSYTGLRVAVTFVRFLQRFGTSRVVAIDSLALMAARAREQPAARVRTLLDARRGRFHHGAFRWQAGSLVELAPARALPLPEVLNETQAGDLIVLPRALEARLAPELVARAACTLPIDAVRADELFAADLPVRTATFADLEPRYLMGSYAES